MMPMRAFLKAIEKLSNAEGRIEKWFILTLGSATLVIIFVQVLMRYVFKASMGWYYETMLFMYVWSMLIAMAHTWRLERHICYGQVVDSVIKSESMRNKFRLVAPVLFLLFSVFIFGYGIQIIGQRYSSQQESPFLKFPMYIESIMLPIFAFLTFTASLLHIFRLITALRSPKTNATGT